MKTSLFFGFVFTFLIGIGNIAPLQASLKYQQTWSLTTWKSIEYLEKKVEAFCQEAQTDPDVHVVNVKYRKKKLRKSDIPYEGTITCYVAEEDISLMKLDARLWPSP